MSETEKPPTPAGPTGAPETPPAPAAAPSAADIEAALKLASQSGGPQVTKQMKLLLWAVQKKAILERRFSWVIGLVKGLFSNDTPTRQMSWIFLVSFVTAVTVGSIGTKRFLQRRHERLLQIELARKEAERIKELMERERQNAMQTDRIFSIGAFTIELKLRPGERRRYGFGNMAEIEIVVETDSKEARGYIAANLEQARSQVTNLLVGLDRDELMSKEGKQRLKKLMIDRLNHWVRHGKVENLYISRLTIG